MALTIVQPGVGGTGYSNGFYSFKNKFINGNMAVDQRNAGASISVTTDGVYAVDRFRIGNGGGGTGVFTAQQSTTAPAGFYNSLTLTVTTADSSIAATDWYYFRQWIEQSNIADLNWGTSNAQTVTLSFWVRSSLIGTYGGCVNNSDYGYDYAFSYTINVANTWEYKTVTIPGLTAGTVAAYNGRGFGVTWALGAGSNYLTSTTNSWYAAGATYVPTGSTNWISTNAANFYITGVQIEANPTATSYDFRSYGQELALCQRYTYVVGNTGAIIPFNGVARGLSTWFVNINTPVAMRTTPSLSITGGGTVRATYNGTEVNSSANSSTIGGAALEINFAASWANSNQILLDYYSISGATPAAGSAALALTFNYGSFIFSAEL